MALRQAGYEVRADADGADLAETVIAFHPDLAIFDVRLPTRDDGFDLAVRLRSMTEIPVLLVTAADALEYRLRGFSVGADDYLVNPFAIAELLARVRAVLRRSGRLTSPTDEVCDLMIDEGNRTVRRAGAEIPLTRTEFDLLNLLARNAGHVFSKTQLLSLVGGSDGYDRNLVEVHVSALRRRLEAHGGAAHPHRTRGGIRAAAPYPAVSCLQTDPRRVGRRQNGLCWPRPVSPLGDVSGCGR